MTFTYNGIGTRYHGRTNIVDRPADCPWCKKPVRLSSYDTRMWFVVIYIPVIPLRRLRILDQCPRCSRHQIVEHSRWVLVQEEARNKAGVAVQERRDDPAGAIEAHKTLLGAHLIADADALAEAMRARFDRSADVHVHLADVATLRGKVDEAHAGYERAFAIDPKLPAACEGVTLVAIRSGDLDRALQLMQPVLDARTARNPAAGCALAGALVAAKRHAEAHWILKSMLELFPTLTADKAFAKSLRKCEKALDKPRTSLRVGRDSTRKLLIAATVVLLAMVGVVWADRQAAAHLTLHVVNGAEGAVIVEIPGAENVAFNQPGRQELELAEGTYVAHVRGAVKRDIPFTLKSSRWPSFMDNAVHVLDASGDSMLWLEEATYSSDANKRFTTHRLLEVHDFAQWTGIDLPFQDFPNLVTVSSRENSARRTRLSLVEGRPEHAVFQLLALNEVRQAFDFAQARLKRTPDSEPLLQGLVAAALTGNLVARADAYLAPRLETRPPDVVAHRASQSLHSNPAEERTVIKRYDELLAHEPNEPAWSFLCGVMSTSTSRRLELLGRASRDERLAPLAWRPLAETQASAADWGSSLDSARRALACDASDYAAQSMIFDALYALDRTDELEHSLLDVVAHEPCYLDGLFQLSGMLARTKSDREAGAIVEPLEHRAMMSCPEAYGEVRHLLDIAPAWARSDYARVVQMADQSKDPMLHSWRLCALAEMGKTDELRAWLDPKKGPDVEGYVALGMALACKTAGDDQQAGAWEQLGISKLQGSGAEAQVARMLRREKGSDGDTALDLALEPREKAIVLGLLSFSNERSREKLVKRALELRPGSRFPRATLERLATSGR